ncbi:MAG: NAD(P)-dependent alcohol dehydrogenase [Elusimicrobia bacterium]|nr:NAD(P)-dependent alcohol dehydrogenase [Elusimicrobiota bacterium]
MLTKAYAVRSATSALEPFELERREPGPTDIEIEIAYCGICHSDIHQARNEWGNSLYPMVPGHEIAGRVSKAGAKVRGFRPGDHAGIGCLVDSCRRCSNCREGVEQFCERGASFTYNSTEQDRKTPTFGGYSSRIVVDEAFALRIPASQPLERIAPLFCAGITTYSPLKRFGVRRGQRVGVLGLGGLGHMAVKIAAALGAEVTVLSGSPAKRADAKRLGAHDFALTSELKNALALQGRFDLILDTVAARHDVNAALGWLKIGGQLVLVGAPPEPLEVNAFSLLTRKSISGSVIGGLAETQEMLDFCVRKKVVSDVEVISIRQVNEAYERMMRGDVRYRFVIDLKTL